MLVPERGITDLIDVDCLTEHGRQRFSATRVSAELARGRAA